ncbi:G-patch domain-containing protein [Artemisia annua]|uniref:G-patch domain-containing protein n=1 Tax=Artemisia annua TaxID=35608 RepID=A0A2U1P012_ARTAN|nr:G-patch domain-containing protein [Artemisia annua]
MNFSLKSSNKKPQSKKPSQQPPTQKQFISEFDPSKPPLNPNPNTPNTTITPISNNWRTPKTKPLDLPTKSDDPNLAFESSSLSVDPADASNLTYGLNVRKKGTTPSNKSVNVVSNVDNDDNVFTGKSGSAIDSIMINKLRGDLDNLPEDRGLEEFDEMPVENFATALLKGYGWEEGMGVGKNKKDVKVVEFKRRDDKQGLGFVNDMPAPPSNEKSSDRRDRRDGKSRKENGSVEKRRVGKGVERGMREKRRVLEMEGIG